MPDDRRVLEGVERLIVDGTNVLYALSRSSSPVPAAALIGRLRAAVPAGVAIVVVLDGSPEHGLVARRVASGVEVRYAGRTTADETIAAMVEQGSIGNRGVLGSAGVLGSGSTRSRPIGSGSLGSGSTAKGAGLLVVTDDIELSERVRRAGGRTVRNGWLIGRLGRQRLSAPVAGKTVPGSIGRPVLPDRLEPSPGTYDAGETDEQEARRWSPGRGATRKRGNPRRGH